MPEGSSDNSAKMAVCSLGGMASEQNLKPSKTKLVFGTITTENLIGVLAPLLVC